MYYIYRLISPNGKVYIGQTKNFRNRMYDHSYCSERGCTKLSNSIKKYGWDNFTKEILFLCSEKDVDIIECKLISFYKKENISLNLDSGGNACKVQSEESCLKRAESMKGKHAGKNNPMYGRKGVSAPAYGRVVSKETRDKFRVSNILNSYMRGRTGKLHLDSKPLYQIDCSNGKIIREWDCLAEVKRVLEIDAIQACNGRATTAGGFIWIYKEDYSEDKLNSILNRIYHLLQLDSVTNDVIKRWKSTEDVKRELGINSSSVSMVCNGKRKNAGGFGWKNENI